jgi:glycosyltransferase involved in cell wall biosynthesis
MTQPRILFLDHTAALGGAELYLLDIARHFRETSRVVLFESGPFKDRLEANDVPVEVCTAPKSVLSTTRSSGWASAITSGVGLVRLGIRVARRAREFDVVYANSQKALFVAGLAGTLARRPVIWNLHDILTSEHFSQFNRRAATVWANLFTERVVVNSEATQTAFVESGGDANRTVIVYNGIDASPFDEASKASSDQLRARFDFPDAPLVGMFSRLAPWKGQHIVLQALSHLPDARGVFVGDTLFHGDKPHEDELHRIARDLGVQDRVHFLGFRDDIPALMRAMDVVVHASTQPEPFGRVIVEGMLAKRPVIAARAGGAKEIVDHGQTGLLTDPGDSKELARAIQRLITNPGEARQIAEAGRQSAVRRFSSGNMISNVSDIVQKFADS